MKDFWSDVYFLVSLKLLTLIDYRWQPENADKHDDC